MSSHEKSPLANETTGPVTAPPSNAEQPARQLKLINVSPSADGRHIDLHFVARDNRVTMIQLEATLAAVFHLRLGETLSGLNTHTTPTERARMN